MTGAQDLYQSTAGDSAGMFGYKSEIRDKVEELKRNDEDKQQSAGYLGGFWNMIKGSAH